MANKLTGFGLACVLLSATVASPQTPGAQFRPGQMDAEQVARAEAALKADIAASPNQINTYIQLANLYRMDSRYDEAEAVLRQGLQIAPRSEALFGTLVSLHPAMYEPEEVLKIADEWAAAIPTSVRPVVFRAIAQLEMTKRAKRSRAEAIGHLELALQAIDRAKQIDATDPGLSSVHAQALRLQADFESDPTERARLRAQADEIMQRSRSAQRPLPPDRSAFETGSAIASAPTNIPFGPSGAVRVGGNIRQPAKIKDVRPLYPPEALEARIQGVVILEIVVGEDGKVADARVLRSIPLLDQAAVDAVRQWEFELTALNGRPVPVIMTVTVSFNMQ